ncbi:MAG TPA: acyltransferase [Steroidobacteraceae bacterium]|nr:acyltransferase [Steroidobacteraceae bacterium]
MRAFSKVELGNEKYPALTGIRALGASVVFFEHFPVWPQAHVTLNVMAFFYVLSGFLIVRIYYEQARLRLRWLAKYFVNRFARIYPLYFLLLSVAVLLRHDFHAGVLLKNYTLTHALFHGSTPIIQPSWSLTVEECFYFLAPGFMLLARRYGFGAPFAAGWLLLLVALGISTLGFAFLGTPLFVLTTTFFGHFVEFFAGIYLALAVMRAEKRGALALPGNRRTLLGLAGVALAALASVLVYRHTPLNFYAVVLVDNFLIPLPIGLLYWGLLRENTGLARLLAARASGLLGRGSYSFYLLHGLVIDYVSLPLLLPLCRWRALCVLLSFAVTWLAAVALFVFFEEPVNLLIRRRFRSKDRSVGMQATLFQVPQHGPPAHAAP